MAKAKSWRTGIGMIVGLAVGVLVWWSAYQPGPGLLQNPQLIVIPAALGAVVVTLRNRWKKVGAYYPETVERNKSGIV